MPSASDINAGGAVVSIGGDASSLNSVLSQAQSKLQAFGSAVGNIGLGLGAGAAAIGALGAAIVAPFAAGLASLQEVAPGIARAARITGLSFEQVQDMAAGARISFEDMPGVIQKMSASIVDARNPTSQMARDFAELGLNINALNGQDAQGQLAMIADALSNVTDEARRMDLARNILGRSGAGINLSGGAAGINARAERNREIGGFISSADVRAGLDFARAQNELKIASAGLSRVLGAVLAPVMTWIAEKSLAVVMAIRGWVDQHRTLFGLISKFGVFLGFVATILGTVGAAFLAVSGIITVFAPVTAFIATAWGVLVSIFIAALPYLIAIGLAVLAVWGVMKLFGVTLIDVWNAIVRVWNAIVNAIDWMSVLTVILTPLVATFVALIFIVRGFWAIVSLIDWARIGTAVVNTFVVIYNVISWVVSTIYRVISSVYSFVSSIFSNLFGNTDSIFASMVNGFLQAFSEIRAIVSNGVETVQAMIGDIAVGFGGIGDAINAGDWAAAFEIGLITIQLLWERAKNFILDTWYRVAFIVGSVWDALVNGLRSPLRSVLETIVSLFYRFLGGIQTAINNMIFSLNMAMEALPEDIRPAMIRMVNITNGEQAALAAVRNALGGNRDERVLQQADRTRQEELQAQQAALAERAAMDAWIAQEQAAIQSGGVGRSQSGQAAMQFGSSMGAFSAAALSQVGSGNYAERTANAVEAMVPGINRVGDLLENDEGGVFQ